MVKQCAIEDLEAGMVLARSVHDENADILLNEGTILSDQVIDSLLERPIFSVYIRIDDPSEVQKDISSEAGSHAEELSGAIRVVPEKKTLLDTEYMELYNEVLQHLKNAFGTPGSSSQVNMEEVGELIASGNLLRLCDGVKAVTQIHNMSRSDGYLLHHSLHVAVLAGLMGSWLRLPRETRQKLMIAGMLHDVGKLRISKDIMEKKGRLSLSERKIIQRHPLMSYEMLKCGQLANEREILAGIAQHHERNDGSGYPMQLHKEEISDFGRILAILDIYDAMAADRSYAKRRSPYDVFNILSDDIIQGRLDTEYGILFVRRVCHALNGNWVKLSNGAKAKIIYIDESRVSALPVVQTTGGEFIDLDTHPDIKIESLLTSDEIMED